MTKLILATTVLLAVYSTANAAGVGCPVWMCGANGSTMQGVLLNGVTLKHKAGWGESVVNAVILPTGEIVNLH